jgi:hypothetical protein
MQSRYMLHADEHKPHFPSFKRVGLIPTPSLMTHTGKKAPPPLPPPHLHTHPRAQCLTCRTGASCRGVPAGGWPPGVCHTGRQAQAHCSTQAQQGGVRGGEGGGAASAATLLAVACVCCVRQTATACPTLQTSSRCGPVDAVHVVVLHVSLCASANVQQHQAPVGCPMCAHMPL